MEKLSKYFKPLMLFLGLALSSLFLSFFILKIINTTIMSFYLEVFKEQVLAILVCFGVIYLIQHKFIPNKNGKKLFYVALVIFGIYNFETPNEFTKREFNKYYASIAKDNSKFESSEIAKELKTAINTLDYDKLNLIFKDSNLYRSIPNKKVEGLSESELLEKKMFVKAINDRAIDSMFADINKKEYVTLQEYDDFKNKVSKYEEENKSKLSQEQKLYILKVLLKL